MRDDNQKDIPERLAKAIDELGGAHAAMEVLKKRCYGFSYAKPTLRQLKSGTGSAASASLVLYVLSCELAVNTTLDELRNEKTQSDSNIAIFRELDNSEPA